MLNIIQFVQNIQQLEHALCLFYLEIHLGRRTHGDLRSLRPNAARGHTLSYIIKIIWRAEHLQRTIVM